MLTNIVLSLLVFLSCQSSAEIAVADGAGLSPFSDVSAVSNLGQARQSLELVSMNGRGGLTPKLALSYGRRWMQAEAGNHWSLQLPRVLRSPDRLPTYDGRDRFLSTRYGQLIKTEDGYYRPVNGAAGVFFAFDGRVWIEFRPSGQRTVYGGAEASIGQGGRENAWLISRDLGENCPAISCDRVEYAYASDHRDDATRGWPRLVQVRYNFVGGVAKTKLELAYEKRSVRRTNFAYSESLVEDWRLRSVTLDHAEERALENVLEYEGDDLVRVRKLGRQGLPFPSVDVEYTPAADWTFSNVQIRGEGEALLARQIGAYVVADFDGDGIPDFYYQEQAQGRLRKGTLRDGALVFAAATDFGNAEDLGARSPLAFLADMNGDGLVDFLQFLGEPKVRWNSPRVGWSTKAPLRLPDFANANRSGVEVVDVNRDGLIDFVTRYDRTCWINDGKGRFDSLRAPTPIGPARISSSHQSTTLVLGDVNGDHLVDFLELEGTRLFVYFGNGVCSWSERTPLDTSEAISLTSRKVLADVDGDGFGDLLSIGAGEVTVFRNDGGRGFVRKQSLRIEANAQISVADIDGNGTKEIISCKQGQGCQGLRLDLPVQPGLLRAVESSLGERTEYAYKPVTADYSAEWSRFVPFIGPVVSSQRTTDGLGVDSLTEYAYVNSHFDPWLREFNGYEIVRERNPESKDGGRSVRPARTLERIYDLGLRQNESEMTATVRRGSLLRSSMNERVFRTETIDYAEDAGLVTPVVSRRSEYRQENGGAVGRTTVSRYNAYGQLTEETEYPTVSAADALPRAAWTRRLALTYAVAGDAPASENDPFASRVISRRSVDARGAVLEAQTLEFENVQAGRVRSAKTLGCGDQWTVQNFEYDPQFTSLVTRVVDGSGKVIQSRTYDATGLWVQQQTNGTGEAQQLTVDPVFGHTLKTEDPNGLVVTNTYDGRGELIGTEHAKSGKRLRSSKTEVSLGSRGRPTQHLTEAWNASGPPARSLTFLDPRGETLMVYKPSPNGEWIVHSWSGRATGGELAWKLNFPEKPGSSRPGFRSEMSYDADGRLLAEFDSRSGLVTEYAESLVSCASGTCLARDLLDKNGRVTRTIFDGLQRKIALVYPDAGKTSTYLFDYRGANASAVTFPSGKKREVFTVGQQTCEVRDPYSGTVRQTFDERGRLSTRSRGGQIEERVQYDAADRPVLRETVAASGKRSRIVTTYGRDARTNSIGRVARVDWEGGADANEYAPTGEVIALSRRIDLPDGPKSFRVEREYDSLGRMLNERLGADRVDYAYDAAGLVNRVPGLVPAIQHDDFGRRVRITFADGSEVGYEHLPGYLQNKSLFVRKGADQFTTEYAYDREMNVIGRVRSDGTEKLAFGYGGGALYFLESQRGEIQNVPTNEAYDYDPDGTPRSANAQRNEIGQSVLADAARLTFDARDHVDSVSTEAARVSYAFDYAGELAVRSKNGLTTDVLLTPSLRLRGADLKPVFQARIGGLVVAEREIGGETRFTHYDQTGTPVTETSNTSAGLERIVFDGWGRARVDQRAEANSLVPGLNLGRVDRTTGQLLYGSRHYSPDQQQFLSTDKSLLEQPMCFVDDPVQFNPFSFNRNNALKFADPTGKEAVTAATVIYLSVIGGMAAWDGYSTYQIAKKAEVSDRNAFAMAGVAAGVSFGAGFYTAGGSRVILASGEHLLLSSSFKLATSEEAVSAASKLMVQNAVANGIGSFTKNATNQALSNPDGSVDFIRAAQAGAIDAGVSMFFKAAAQPFFTPLLARPLDWAGTRVGSKLLSSPVSLDKGIYHKTQTQEKP